jgi:membrane associated rhomboid family serine protease
MILTPAVRFLVLSNIAIFLAEILIDRGLVSILALWPLGPRFHFWQLLTYAFIHGGLAHIAFNMLGLVVFGSDLERLWGSRRLITCYLVAVLAAAGTQLMVSSLTDSQAPTIGASGGVFGLLLAFAILFPDRQILLLFPPIPLPSRLFAFGYAAIELFLGVTTTGAGIAHFAHLGGMLGGYVYLLASRHW